MHIGETSRYLRDNNKKLWRKSRNIAFNLCMILPPPDNAELKKHKNSWKEDINERAYSYFMWSPWRFEKILGNG